MAEKCHRFLESLVLPDCIRVGLEIVLEAGFPGSLLREHLRRHPADLMVLGSRAQSMVRDILLGSSAQDILAAVPCNALVVPPEA